MTSQPKWSCIANLGDVNPIEYGGIFVFVDSTKVYPPEMEILEEPPEDSENQIWTVYRIILDTCTYQNGILSGNRFHPECPTWFADDIDSICSFADYPDLIADLCSSDPCKLTQAYRVIGDYWGFNNFDSYPLSLNRREVWGRYNSRIRKLARQS